MFAIIHSGTDHASQIEGALKRVGGNFVEGKPEESGHETLRDSFTVEIDNRENFSRASKSLRTTPSVVNV